MTERTTRILERLKHQFPDIDFAPAPLLPGARKPTGQTCIRIAPARLVEVMRFLHDDLELAFDQLADLTCVDYLEFPEATDRFGVVYTLLSVRHGHRLWVKCFVNDPEPTVPSVFDIWHGADWMEREVWDLFGVRFEGHPDLRRIVTWEGFEAHPLRKDYPLHGRGERESLPVVGRESTDVQRESAAMPMREETEN